mmetsp:Transcript_22868/g.58293  ORF Transcript_22868/g.58293 Transcript_22868/m.58293 type:complete len:660 (-) Transcript_22868:571-2550(-)|eukprot:CAMPEP_0202859014 /NCGR_PEP_ID=MMETSP1391-20130828/1313_1 /ASSEMBLY_ACC=CAM_ASM_000867 /TAXON_ID=1034604 /ORGANISM="Chlamydomonas leiostraca, Strain SAG 11-49" /LENGTH=659 /DNA_ID=CAMNT_0049538011 /DNA_START=156 /DNA_END=2135 /DNA_ORIENTATION=-
MERACWACWFVVLASLWSYTHADVYISTRAYSLDPISDLPADFGPDVPDEGVDGMLRLADPEDACTPFTFEERGLPWVALIARHQPPLGPTPTLNCTFDVKVRFAEAAGAVAAIVYDDVPEPLIIMSKPRAHPDPGIPAVFVSQHAGAIMRQLLAISREGVYVRVTPVSAVAWISMVLSAFLGMLALTIVFSTFWIMRSWSIWLAGGRVGNGGPGQAGAGGAHPGQGGRGPAHEGGLPASVLRALPVIVYEPLPASRAHSLQGAAQLAQDNGEDDGEASKDGGLTPGAGGYARGGSSCASSEYEQPLPPGLHAGETKHVCAVCLEAYEQGDKIRVLPCYHRFHMQCVDQWLASRRLCPCCKHDASKPHPATLPAADTPAAGRAEGQDDVPGSDALAQVWARVVSYFGGAPPPPQARGAGATGAAAPAQAAAAAPPPPTSQASAGQPAVGAAAAAAAGATHTGVTRRALRARLLSWLVVPPWDWERRGSGGAGEAGAELRAPLLTEGEGDVEAPAGPGGGAGADAGASTSSTNTQAAGGNDAPQNATAAAGLLAAGASAPVRAAVSQRQRARAHAAAAGGLPSSAPARVPSGSLGASTSRDAPAAPAPTTPVGRPGQSQAAPAAAAAGGPGPGGAAAAGAPTRPRRSRPSESSEISEAEV